MTGATDSLQIRVRPGAGWVIRRGPLVAVVAPTGDVDAVLAAIDAFDVQHGTSADLVGAARDLAPATSFAAAVIGAEVDVVLLGEVRCVADATRGSAAYVGSAATQLVGLPADVMAVSLHLGLDDHPADPRTSLDGGCVPGAGADIRLVAVDDAPTSGMPRTTGAPQPTPTPLPPPLPPMPPPPPLPSPDAAPEPMPAASSVSVVNVLSEPLDEPDRFAPLPEGPDEVLEESRAAKAVVRGLACSVGHVNRLDSPYCSSCGRRLQGTVNLVEGPRPSLGTLIFDDGTAFGLDHGYMIGRDPSADTTVVSGRARALPLADTERTISRVHAEIRLDGWDTVIIDRGSANGTFVAAPDGTGWRRLAPDAPVVLQDDWSVAIGRRTFVFQRR